VTNHLWQSTVFAVVAGLLTLVFRKNRAQVRYWLWFSASVKFLVPFWLLISLGSQVERRLSPVEMATPAISFAAVQIAEPFFDEPSSGAPPGKVNWVVVAIVVVWVCGFAVIGLIRLRGWLRVRAALRSSAPTDIRAAVDVRSTPGLLEPGVVGLFRPVLLLPSGIGERLLPRQLDAVLAHELCHVRRRDNLTSAVHMAVEALFWFHPLVWWIGARLLEERERACDEAVLRLGSSPQDYAGGILNVCKSYLESPLRCVSGVTGSNLKKRIDAIMINRPASGLNGARKLVLASAGVAALAGPVAIGLVIGIGDAPVVRAQFPAAIPPMMQTRQAGRGAPVNAVATAEPEERRLVAILFDLNAMTSDEQSRARESAVDFVQNRMGPADVVAIMAADNGKLAVVNDFTNDRSALGSAIRSLRGNGAAADTGSLLSDIETAARQLAVFPEKKALMYFASGLATAGDHPADLQNAIDAARQSNVALYPIDVRSGTPQIIVPAGLGGRSMAPQPIVAAGLPQDEYNHRLQYAEATFGPTGKAISRIYIRYGQPDTIDARGSNSQNPSQIWRYNYLEDFRSSVEFEFQKNTANNWGMRINWPLPATYEGAPALDAALAEKLSPGMPGASNAIAGLPGSHASFQIFPAKEFRTLTVPLDSLSGRVEVVAQIRARPATGTVSPVLAVVRDSVAAPAGIFQTNFTLPGGSYACHLVVKEQATGRMFGEEINFEAN
jgi:beta-lactamase regulating signal transducer with metallopeptidase domain